MMSSRGRFCAPDDTTNAAQPQEFPKSHEHAPGPVSINALARDTHAKWLASGDRRYSPFNKPWPELHPEHRAQTSRQVRNNIDMIRAAGHLIPFIDEYAEPGPGDVRWSDPEAVPCGGWCTKATPQPATYPPPPIGQGPLI